MTDKLVVRIEDGAMYYESHEGNWLNEHHDEIMDYFNDQVDSLHDDKGVTNALFDSKRDSTIFLVTIPNPTVEIEPGRWTNSGWDSGYIYIDWKNDSITVEPIPEPVPQLSKDQMTFADILGTEQ
jgi:hypothetical protein